MGFSVSIAGLLRTSIRCEDPVLFLEHATLYQLRGEVPEGEHLVPIGRSAIQRPGRDVTLVTYSKMLEVSQRAAGELAKEGVDVAICARRKEPLEDFPLDSLKMVGTLERGKRFWAIVQAPDGTVHKLEPGNHAGQNFGKVKKITEEKVELLELIQGALGDWVEREASLAITE